jgi:hypothetical protein
LFLALRPVFGVLHEATVLALSCLLRAATDSDLWPRLIALLPLDPVYTLAFVRFAGEIEPRGLALAGWPGSALAAWLPGIFADPAHAAAGAWASAVLAPGATVVARALVGLGADVVLLAVGLGLWRVGLRHRPWLAVCGGLQIAHVGLFHLLTVKVSLRDLEAAGLPFAVSALQSSADNRAPWFTVKLAEAPPSLVSAIAGALALVVALGLAWVLVAAAGVLVRRPRPVFLDTHRRWPLVACTLVLALTPVGTFAEASTTVLASQVADPGLATAPIAAPGVSAAVPRGSVTPVWFEGNAYRYRYMVDGVPTVIRGMGYNVQYSSLPTDQRVERYNRDFALIRASGANTIYGWFETQFDEVTLDAAERAGLGVGMPFELNQDWHYDDPAVREEITQRVLAYVAKYKDHPAVRMWTPANEVIHRLIFPSWLRHEAAPDRERQADSFARFYVQLIDRIHALDPRHPVVYRDAEDAYLARIRTNLLADGKPRPWFAYGANVYSRQLGEILRRWPTEGLDVPLFISEFAPGGTGPADRPSAFQAQWSLIRSYPDYVIGGAVYTWATDGPEELDRVFGLVDDGRAPRDGSLAAIAQMYQVDERRQTASPTP